MTFEMALVRMIRTFMQSVGYKYPRVKKLSRRAVNPLKRSGLILGMFEKMHCGMP